MLQYLEYYESKCKDYPGFFVSPFPGDEFEPQGPFATLELAKREAEKIAREEKITDIRLGETLRD